MTERVIRRVGIAVALAAALAGLALTAGAARADDDKPSVVRFSTFNASLNRNAEGQLVADLSTQTNAQAKTVAEIIQRTRPDVLLINEFDFVENDVALDLFHSNYLQVPQGGAAALTYPYRFVAPSNTGIPTGFDLNNNGIVGGADDAFGFGAFPGQFGMAVYSMYPIQENRIRTFQNFLWKDMPGSLLLDPGGTPPLTTFYSPDERAILRLSSKSHWDIPILVGDKTVHFLTSHPTPPVFDGAEDRNGKRNFDEIRLWADYITPGPTSRYIYDDAGRRGGLQPGSLFVIAGDQNSDPLDGDSIDGAIQQLLDHPLVNASNAPSSPGATQQSALQGGANTTHQSDPAFDTADFSDTAPGNLRADYVLPRKNMRIRDSGVFWPLLSDPLFSLVGTFPFPSSDHRLVWIDVTVPGNDD